MARRLCIMPGMLLDLTGVDKDDGKPWDFNVKEKREKALDMVLKKEALLLIGSPMCKSFSKLMNWNWKRMKPERRDAMIKEGKAHLQFCMMLYRIQAENGLYFLHERPYSASCWKEPCVEEVMAMEKVQVVRGDMCAFGMWQHSDKSQEGVELVMEQQDS